MQKQNQDEKRELDCHLCHIIQSKQQKLAEQEECYEKLQAQLDSYQAAVKQQQEQIEALSAQHKVHLNNLQQTQL
jgi:hypothetical protein